MPGINFGLINLILIHVIKLWRQYRDANPDQPNLTDAEVIALLKADAQAIVDKGEKWLADHPPTA